MIGYAAQPKSWLPTSGSEKPSSVTSKPTTGMSAIAQTPSSFVPGWTRWMSSQRPEQRDEQRADQNPEVRAVGAHEDRRGDQDSGHDRDAADPRNGARVHTRAVTARVDAADARRDPGDERREHEDDAGGGQERPDRVAVPDQGTERLGEGHAAVIAEAPNGPATGSPASATATLSL